MTSSIQPEVHNVAMPPEKDRATDVDKLHKKLAKIGRVILEICVRTDRQINTQTDTLNAMLCYPTRGRVDRFI